MSVTEEQKQDNVTYWNNAIVHWVTIVTVFVPQLLTYLLL